MTVAVLVPWRPDGGERDKLWAWCSRRWLDLGYSHVEGHDISDQPFNVARAFNRAARTADDTLRPDVYILMGADHVPDANAVETAAARAYSDGWAPLFAQTWGVGKHATRDVLRGETPPERAYCPQKAPFCTALMAVRVDVWRDIKGMDETFSGWGCEDTALRCVLETLYGKQEAPAGSAVRALYHEPAPRDHFQSNAALLAPYVAAEGNPTAMREVIAMRP